MGTTFTHFNPLCDENGQNLSERFATNIKNITEKTNNVYMIYIREGECYKYKINDNVEPVKMGKTSYQLFRYIFGAVLRNYVDDIRYKNMSPDELDQICYDFTAHLHNTSNIILGDPELERFSVKFPNNAFAKYADLSKIYFAKIIEQDTRKTLFFHFPIQIEEKGVSYHVVLTNLESRDISLSSFNPFEIDMKILANGILKDLDKLSIVHIKKNGVYIQFVAEKDVFKYCETPLEFYKVIFGMYKEYVDNDEYKNMTEEDLVQICNDFELYLNHFNTNEIEYDETNKSKYLFHVLFPNNLFSKCVVGTYMSKILDETGKKVKYHYLPIEISANNMVYNAVINKMI